MKSARKQYIREQKTICGDSYAEVDFCWITVREHRAGPRGKKQFASSLAQQKRNRERSARLLVQLLNTNFDQRGFALTLTYEDMWLPDDDEAAWKDVYNYLKRVRRWLTRKNWQDATPIKWVCVTENQEADPANGLKEVRYHHHMVLQVDGLTAAHRAALRGVDKATYLRREKVWAVVCVVVGCLMLAAATYYNLVVRPNLGA